MSMTKIAEEENLCRRCGISCHPAIQVGRLKVVLPDVHCRFLEKEESGSYACTVYEDRFEKAPWCLWAVEAKKDSLLSVDCPYHEGKRDPNGKSFLNDRLLQSVVGPIAVNLLEHGVPEWVTTKGVINVIQGAGYRVTGERLDPDGRRYFEVDD